MNLMRPGIAVARERPGVAPTLPLIQVLVVSVMTIGANTRSVGTDGHHQLPLMQVLVVSVRTIGATDTSVDSVGDDYRRQHYH